MILHENCLGHLKQSISKENKAKRPTLSKLVEGFCESRHYSTGRKRGPKYVVNINIVLNDRNPKIFFILWKALHCSSGTDHFVSKSGL